MLNDSTRKKYLTQNGYSRSFKVICFDVDEKPSGDYILRHNSFGLIYEHWKDIATARSKNGNFLRPNSHLMSAIQRTPTDIDITFISSQSTVSALHFRRW